MADFPHFFFATAFEMAEEMLHSKAWAFCLRPGRQELNFFLLLAHYSPHLLQYTCRDLAVAAIISSLRLGALTLVSVSEASCNEDTCEGLPPGILTAETAVCVNKMWALWADLATSGEQPLKAL